MAKQKLYDNTLVDRVRQRREDYSNYLSPKVDIDQYTHAMSNPSQLDTPDSWSTKDWASNAFYDWNLTRNQTNKYTALGDYVYLQEDYDTLVGAKEYLNAINEILQLDQQLKQEPNSDIQELMNQAQQRAKETRSAYDKLLNRDFNNNFVKDFIYPDKLIKMTPSQQIGAIDTLLGTEDGKLPGTDRFDDQTVTGKRAEALERYKKYSNFTEYWKSKMV